jgi:hypothetical protein
MTPAGTIAADTPAGCVLIWQRLQQHGMDYRAMAVVDPIPTAKASAARSATPFALFQDRQPRRINDSMLTLHHNVGRRVA